MWQGWVNLLLGVWLLLSGLIPALQTPENLIISGLLVAVLGFWSYKNWLGDTSGVLGLWALFSGSWLNLFSPSNFLITGVLIGSCGFWEAFTHPKSNTPYFS